MFDRDGRVGEYIISFYVAAAVSTAGYLGALERKGLDFSQRLALILGHQHAPASKTLPIPLSELQALLVVSGTSPYQAKVPGAPWTAESSEKDIY